MGNAGFLQMTLSEGVVAQEVASEIESEARKGAQLVHQLLAFSRRQELEPRIVDLAEAVSDFLPMGRATLGDSGRVLRTNISSGPCPVSIDPSQLDQVLMNLVVNARDAMPTGGNVTITVLTASPDTVSDQGPTGTQESTSH